MFKVLTLSAILLVSVIGVSAQTANKEAEVIKPVAYKTKETSRSKAGVVELGPRSTYLKEGLSLAAVMKVLGTPSVVSERVENHKVVRDYEWSRGEGRTLSAQFVNDVLVHFQTVEITEPGPRTAGS